MDIKEAMLLGDRLLKASQKSSKVYFTHQYQIAIAALIESAKREYVYLEIIKELGVEKEALKLILQKTRENDRKNNQTD